MWWQEGYQCATENIPVVQRGRVALVVGQTQLELTSSAYSINFNTLLTSSEENIKYHKTSFPTFFVKIICAKNNKGVKLTFPSDLQSLKVDVYISTSQKTASTHLLLNYSLQLHGIFSFQHLSQHLLGMKRKISLKYFTY